MNLENQQLKLFFGGGEIDFITQERKKYHLLYKNIIKLLQKWSGCIDFYDLYDSIIFTEPGQVELLLMLLNSARWRHLPILLFV